MDTERKNPKYGSEEWSDTELLVRVRQMVRDKVEFATVIECARDEDGYLLKGEDGRPIVTRRRYVDLRNGRPTLRVLEGGAS